VHLQLSAQHTWSQLSACLSSIVCPFCISSHPQLGRENKRSWESLLHLWASFGIDFLLRESVLASARRQEASLSGRLSSLWGPQLPVGVSKLTLAFVFAYCCHSDLMLLFSFSLFEKNMGPLFSWKPSDWKECSLCVIWVLALWSGKA
jgi:hypothetical protein